MTVRTLLVHRRDLRPGAVLVETADYEIRTCASSCQRCGPMTPVPTRPAQRGDSAAWLAFAWVVFVVLLGVVLFSRGCSPAYAATAPAPRLRLGVSAWPSGDVLVHGAGLSAGETAWYVVGIEASPPAGGAAVPELAVGRHVEGLPIQGQSIEEPGRLVPVPLTVLLLVADDAGAVSWLWTAPPDGWAPCVTYHQLVVAPPGAAPTFSNAAVLEVTAR